MRFRAADPGDPGLVAVSLDDGWLSAAADFPSGEGWLIDADRQVVAQISWTGATAESGWGTCALAAPERVEVSGEVVWSDGTSAGGHLLRGCEGDRVQADDDGRFSLTAVAGLPCRLRAFVAADDLYGLGPRVEIGPLFEPLAGVEVPAPEGDALRDRAAHLEHLELLTAVIDQAQMAAAMVPNRFDELDPNASEEAQEISRRWLRALEAREDAEREALQAVLESGDPAVGLDAWLDLH